MWLWELCQTEPKNALGVALMYTCIDVSAKPFIINWFNFTRPTYAKLLDW
jgi:hypothetical protein